MGVYLNPRNDGFWEAVRSDIYVDKTELIKYTNSCLSTEQKFLCVSRPRRFGKSIALRMLSAYYSRGCDSRELFAGKKIESDPSFAEHLNQYDVIFLNMQHFLIGAASGTVTECLEQKVLKELLEEYGTNISSHHTALADALNEVYARIGKKFIFLFDEWDCIMRERQESERDRKSVV